MYANLKEIWNYVPVSSTLNVLIEKLTKLTIWTNNNIKI